jgi:segregation and condensation protein A
LNIPNTQPYAEEAIPDTPDPQSPALLQVKSDTFQVQLEVFSGPLDLLLKLIERKQLDISKVALAEVAEGFLAYLEAHPDMPPGPLAAFVWVAGKLLLIKSQALLPRPPVPTDDDEEDPGDELVRRLEAYKRVQEAARWLRSRETEGLRSYVRPVPLQALPARPKHDLEGTGLDGVTLAKLVRMVQKRMQLALPTPVPAGAVVEGHTITVAEKVAQLRKQMSHLKKGERMPLGAEFAEAAARSRTELAVLFLAVLEIIRRKHGTAEQDELFGEIWLKKLEVRS